MEEYSEIRWKQRFQNFKKCSIFYAPNMKNNKYGLSEKHQKIIQNIFSAYPQIQKKILFGSRAKGNYKKYSDIDFAIDGKNLSFSLLSDIKDDFTESLLPYFVDIVLLPKLSSQNLKKHIQEYGISF